MQHGGNVRANLKHKGLSPSPVRHRGVTGTHRWRCVTSTAKRYSPYQTRHYLPSLLANTGVALQV
eukprot:1427280-Prymnesium_polylepis.1